MFENKQNIVKLAHKFCTNSHERFLTEKSFPLKVIDRSCSTVVKFLACNHKIVSSQLTCGANVAEVCIDNTFFAMILDVISMPESASDLIYLKKNALYECGESV